MYKRHKFYKKIINSGERFRYQIQNMYHLRKLLLFLGFAVAYIANILLTIFVLMTVYHFFRNSVGEMNFLQNFQCPFRFT